MACDIVFTTLEHRFTSIVAAQPAGILIVIIVIIVIIAILVILVILVRTVMIVIIVIRE